MAGRALSLLLHPAVGVYVTPVVLFGGLVLAIRTGGWFEDFWLDHALPFLIVTWIGAGFAFMYWAVTRGIPEDAHGQRAVAGIAGAVGVLLVAGVGSAVEDPWFFGVAIWPGLALAVPWLRRALAGAPPEPIEPGA